MAGPLAHRTQLALAALAPLAAIAGFIPAASHAGLPVEEIELGKAKGLTYRSANVKVPTGGIEGRHAGCPPDQHVTGGGLDLTGPFGQVLLRATVPTRSDGSGYTAWEGLTGNVSADQQDLRVFAICRGGAISYPMDSTGSLFGPTGSSLPLSCPADTFVTGGGSSVTGGVRISLASPSDDGDGNDRPEDGWFTYFDAPPSTAGSGVAFAACASIDDLAYVSNTKRLAGPGVTAEKAICPPDTAVAGGGAYLFGSFSSQALTSTAPFDGGDAGRTPEDGWRAEMAAFDQGDHRIRTWAICKG